MPFILLSAAATLRYTHIIAIIITLLRHYRRCLFHDIRHYTLLIQVTPLLLILSIAAAFDYYETLLLTFSCIISFDIIAIDITIFMPIDYVI